MKVRFLEVARLELDEAITYYNTESAGLGQVLLLEVLSAIERIRQFPNAWHPLSAEGLPRRLVFHGLSRPGFQAFSS